MNFGKMDNRWRDGLVIKFGRNGRMFIHERGSNVASPGWWLSKVSSRRWLAYRNFHFAKLGEDLRGGGACKGQRTTGKLEDSAAGSFRTLLSRKLTFPPPLLRSSSGLYVWPRLRATLLVDRFPLARIFLPSFCLFFFFLRELSLTPTPFLELCATSSDEINLLESSYVDESVNLQGFKSSKVE